MILPDNIDLANPQKYSLSIRLIPDGFSFSIFSQSDSSVFFTKVIKFSENLSYLDNLKKVFFEVNLFTQPYKKVLITTVTSRYTLIPEKFYDKKSLDKFFNFNFVEAKGKILSNKLADFDAHIIYELNSDVYAFLHRNLWNASYMHVNAHLLPIFGTHKIDEFKKRCFVEFDNSMLTIACFEGNRLLSVNSYMMNEQLDATYHIINIWEKLKLCQNKDGLFLSGDLSEQQSLIDLLKQLVRHVSLFKIKATEDEVETDTKTPTDLEIQLL